MASVVGLFIYPSEGNDPHQVESADPSARGGFEGDWHGARENRAILITDKSQLEGLGLAPGSLREQMTVEGVAIDSLEAGTRLAIGEALLEVTQPCAPCLTIGEYNRVVDREAFRDSLQGRRGAFAKWIEPARVAIGDEVRVETLDHV